MYGLHQTLTRFRPDGLAWRLTVDHRTGQWLPTLIVVNASLALRYHRRAIIRSLNGVSLTVRSQSYARMLLRNGFTGNLLDEVYRRTFASLST